MKSPEPMTVRIHDAGGLALLRQACEAVDRVTSCRLQIEQRGELIQTKDSLRVNPLCGVERDARAAVLRAIAALHLDVEPLKDRGRPTGTYY